MLTYTYSIKINRLGGGRWEDWLLKKTLQSLRAWDNTCQTLWQLQGSRLWLFKHYLVATTRKQQFWQLQLQWELPNMQPVVHWALSLQMSQAPTNLTFMYLSPVSNLSRALGQWGRKRKESTQLDYLHRKRWCEMLICGDDTLGMCFPMFVYIRAHFCFALIGRKSDSSVKGEPMGNWRWNSNSRDTRTSPPSFSHPASERPRDPAHRFLCYSQAITSIIKTCHEILHKVSFLFGHQYYCYFSCLNCTGFVQATNLS